MIRVLLADDHAIVRAGLKELLSGIADITVAGEATDGHDVMTQVRTQEIDVAVLDMSMPGRSGIDLIKQVKAERPKLRVLVLSMHGEKQYAVRAVKAGASGYLTKDSAAEQLVAAIRRIAGGGAYVTPETAERLVLESGAAGDGTPHSRLSDREFQVFQLIASGRSITEIAQQLSLSVKTVSTHKTRLMEKMGLANQAELIRYAIENNIINSNS